MELFDNVIKEPNKTILTLQLPKSLIDSLHRYIKIGYINNEYISEKLEFDLDDSASLLEEDGFFRNLCINNRSKEFTLPMRILLPDGLAFSIGLISQRIQVPMDIIVECALDDIDSHMDKKFNEILEEKDAEIGYFIDEIEGIDFERIDLIDKLNINEQERIDLINELEAKECKRDYLQDELERNKQERDDLEREYYS